MNNDAFKNFNTDHYLNTLGDQAGNPFELAECYYLDIFLMLGEAPGQRASFDRVLAYLTSGDSSTVWHAAMIGFGLALASYPEARVGVEQAVSAFLMIATEGDRA